MKTEVRNGLTAVSAARNEIRKVDIVYLKGLTMGEWYNKQSDKPDILINASLWDAEGDPIGTIWENGKMIRDEGNGFGFGIDQNGGWNFAAPWDLKWVDYLTGYPALIQNAKARPDKVDNYVQNCKNKRSVIATAGDRLYCITANNMTIAQLRTALLNFGVYHAINLDGGGSSRLMVNGKAINSPTDNRRCPNAIAVWLKDETETPVPPKPEQPSENHWAQACLDSLVKKGIITDAAQWSDFNASVSSLTIGQLLALIDKASNYIQK